MSIKVVLFDLDNTLIDRQRIFKEMLMNKLSEYHSNNVEEIANEIIVWDNNGNQNRLVTFQQYVDKYHPNVSAQELNDYWNKNSGKKIYVFEDAEDTLKYLKSKYRLGIVSNGNAQSQRRKLKELPFLDMFDFTVVSGEIGIDKPEVGIFDYAAEKMNVLNSECAFVGDNYRCDIMGSTNANMMAIWKCSKEEFTEQCICIENLSELKKYL